VLQTLSNRASQQRADDSHGEEMIDLSVVVPVFNEQDNLLEAIRRLRAVLDATGKTYEVIFVNDGSKDRSLEILLGAHDEDPRIVVVDLNRNFGQHAAIFAGFEIARGATVITIDADLQNPPEDIPKLLEKVDAGHDVVGSVRTGRDDSIIRRTISFLTNKTTARLTGIKLSDYGCMLRAYSRDVVRGMCQGKEISTFIPALGAALARSYTEVEVTHHPRVQGSSKYNFAKLLSLHLDLVTSFSLKPIRALLYLGVAISLAGMGFGLFLFIRRLIVGPEVEGVFTLFAILFVFVGAQFLAFGLLGEYIGRIYLEVRRRPRFIVRAVHGRSEGAHERPAGQR
jgi:undecaprenyl-phosphate 4-deoxy-4-formamido-L-arabinose transferase